jgi:two-component system cell cycle response regulator
MKVLIVDDSPDALALARVRLGREGLDLVYAGGGKAGLAMAKSERPDLILLDIDMPDMSGFDVCIALKADSELSMIPVIFLSGSGGPEDKVKGLELGAVDYVTKPFDAFELRARVNAALRTKRMQDLLIERANVDPLTGLANRRGLMERLEQEWARVQRRGGALSFIMGDIDHFKEVNDAHGHEVGDRTLREVARAIAGQCRKTDLPCRYGGEEFAIVVPDESASGAAELAERCRQAVEAVRVSVGLEAVRTTASFGAADATGADSPGAMIQHSDEAMYRAKNAGRNRVAV